MKLLSKLFLAFLLFVSAGANSAIAPGTLAKWTLDSTLLDVGANNYNLIDNGTTPFTGVGCPSVEDSAGVFSDTNYLSGPTALNTDMSGEAFLFFEGYFDLNSITNQPVIFYFELDGLPSWVQVLGNGAIKFQTGGLPLQTAGGKVSVLNCYYFALLFRTGSNNSKLWISPADSISSTPDVTTNFNLTPTTVTNFTLGRFLTAASFASNGYISNFRIMNIDPLTIPIDDVDPVTAFSETIKSGNFIKAGGFVKNTNSVVVE